MRRKFVPLVIVLAMSSIGYCSASHAQALPADPISRVITGAMNDNYFFKAEDLARRQSTITKMSDSLVRAAANSPSIGTGTSWLSNLKYLGRLTLPSVAIGLAVDSAVQWYFADDPMQIPPVEDPDPENPNPEPTPLPLDSIRVPAPPNVVSPPDIRWYDDNGYGYFYPLDTVFEITGRLRLGEYHFRANYRRDSEYWVVYGVTAEGVIAYAKAMDDTVVGSFSDCTWGGHGSYGLNCSGMFTFTDRGQTPGNTFNHAINAYLSSSSPHNCPGGTLYAGHLQRCVGDPAPAAGGYDSIELLESASFSLPSTELEKQSNPELLAHIVDQVWLDAASQPGYDGVPHPGYQAVSRWDVETYLNQNPDAWPTVEDLVKSLPRTDPEVWNLPPPTPSSNDPDPGIPNPDGSVDLGPDPNIGPPDLESIPTAEMIIYPLTTLFDDVRTYAPTFPAGECPTPTFEVFDQSYTLSSQCELLEQNRPVIQLFMIAAFAISSLLIVLRA